MRLLEEASSGPEPILVLFLPWLQNPSGHGFLTKEELLQGCAQKAPRVSTRVGGGMEPGDSGSHSEPSRSHPLCGAQGAL